MLFAGRLLDWMPRGSITAVVGRPGAGVSTCLAQMCANASERGAPAVLASWERPATASEELIGCAEVATPHIMNWDVAELERCPEVAAVGAGAVLAVDYLQLIDGDGDESTAGALHALAVKRQLRVVVGVMARRDLAQLEHELSPVRAARLLDHTKMPALRHAGTAVVLTGSNESSRRAVVAVPLRDNATWHVQWTATVDRNGEAKD